MYFLNINSVVKIKTINLCTIISFTHVNISREFGMRTFLLYVHLKTVLLMTICFFMTLSLSCIERHVHNQAKKHQENERNKNIITTMPQLSNYCHSYEKTNAGLQSPDPCSFCTNFHSFSPFCFVDFALRFTHCKDKSPDKNEKKNNPWFDSCTSYSVHAPIVRILNTWFVIIIKVV